jgi:uncharacterized membrane protein
MNQVTREIRTNFITGFLVVLPIIITLWVVWFFTSKVVKFSLILLPHDIPVLIKAFWSIFIITLSILVVILVGITTRYVIGRKLLKFADRFIQKIPVVKWVYEPLKKIAETFLSGHKTKIFEKVVLVEYPRKGIYSIGFMTGNIGKGIVSSEESYINVFIPTAPTPMSGFLIILPEKDVIPLDIPIEEALKYFISIGTILPESKNIKSE